MPKYLLYTEKKKERKVSLTDCKLNVFPPEYKPPPLNIGPLHLSFVHIHAQGILTGFYGMLCYVILILTQEYSMIVSDFSCLWNVLYK